MYDEVIAYKVSFSDAIKSDKEIMEFPAMAHDWNAEFDRYAWKWLKKVL